MKYKLKLKPHLFAIGLLLLLIAFGGVLCIGHTIPPDDYPHPTRDVFQGTSFAFLGIIGFIFIICKAEYSDLTVENTNKVFEDEVDRRVREKVNKLMDELKKTNDN